MQQRVKLVECSERNVTSKPTRNFVGDTSAHLRQKNISGCIIHSFIKESRSSEDSVVDMILGFLE